MALPRASLRAPKTDETGDPSPVIKAFKLMFAVEIDLNDLLEGYRQEEASPLFHIAHEQYVADRNAETRGIANPSVMNKPFWMFQIGPEGVAAWKARTTFGNAEDPFADSEDPVWCFNRLGATRSKLPDGRVLCIGGEHEDGYDPDFCIYNVAPCTDEMELADVVVFDAPQKSNPPPLLTPESIKIYGYPVEVFPPTDFHTSTYFADPATGKKFIFIIGGLGYNGQASRDRTEIYRLDLSDFSIHRLETSGAGPAGGTCEHKAELLNEHEQPTIRITTKEVKEYVAKKEDKESTTAKEGEESITAEEGKESISLAEGEKSIATEKGEVPTIIEEDEWSSMTTPKGKELVTTQESKVFTLRIHDMRWI